MNQLSGINLGTREIRLCTLGGLNRESSLMLPISRLLSTYSFRRVRRSPSHYYAADRWVHPAVS
jgi:hypothetical protein